MNVDYLALPKAVITAGGYVGRWYARRYTPEPEPTVTQDSSGTIDLEPTPEPQKTSAGTWVTSGEGSYVRKDTPQ